MDTELVFNLLLRSLNDLCDSFNKQELLPLLEADITAYLYHRLLVNGCAASSLHSESRVCGVIKARKYDIVIGEVNTRSACVKPILIAQVKCFQRWGRRSEQQNMAFLEIMNNDLEALEEASGALPAGRVQIVTDFVFTSRMRGYLNGSWNKVRRRIALSGFCKEIGVALLWARPSKEDALELRQLTPMGIPLAMTEGRTRDRPHRCHAES